MDIKIKNETDVGNVLSNNLNNINNLKSESKISKVGLT